MSGSNDGSESVDQFLARIASLKEGRDEASGERTKRIEEDFQKNRKERQARRLERARSLSPSKTGPVRSTAVASTPVSTSTHEVALNPPVNFSPQTSTLSRSNAVSLRTSPVLEPKQPSPDPFSSPLPTLSSSSNTTSTLSRSGTLSWQQRPSGRDNGLSRPRPTSGSGSLRASMQDTQSNIQDQEEPTRAEIAASLGLKDPLWFRQTQERGTNSAAYRRNQVEETPAVSSDIRSRRLPGLSREGVNMVESDQSRDTMKPKAVVRSSPTQPITAFALKDAVAIPDIAQGASSQGPEDQTTSEARHGESTFSNPEVSRNVSPSVARSPSPTKGLGGFVQSAMMKRSDSVSKRWSVQANAGLKRGDSVASSRPLSILGPVHSPSLSRDSPTVQRDSQRSPIAATKSSPLPGGLQSSPKPTTTQNVSSHIIKPKEILADVAMTGHETSERPQTPVSDDKIHRSPSKSIDARKWSPTKSSWLESTLLSKPEAPKIAPKVEEQPRWKVDLQRSRSIKNSSPERFTTPVEQSNSKSPEASVDTLSHVRKPKSTEPAPMERNNEHESISGRGEPTAESELREACQPNSKLDGETYTTKGISTKATVSESGENDVPLKSPADATAISGRSLEPEKSTTAPRTDPQTSVKSPDLKLERKPPVVKPKPQTPPKTDFRAALRSRTLHTPGTDDKEPEFKSMFGKLKSAQTKNYVAPDDFKNNILSGKAALNLTDGPQKSKRVDEFKESILQKKDAMKISAEQKKQDVPAQEKTKTESALPEALARRKTLHKATPSIVKNQGEVDQNVVPSDGTRRSVALPGMSDIKGTVIPAAISTAKPLLPQKHTTAQEDKVSSIKSTQERSQISAASSGKSPDRDVRETNSTQSPLEQSGRQLRNSSQEPAALTKAHDEAFIEGQSDQVLSDETTAPLEKIVKTVSQPGGKLASRLNPNLAALISRGNVARPSLNTSQSADSIPQASPTQNTHSPTQASGELTHTTKARAKGPKRRAPKAQASSSVATAVSLTSNDDAALSSPRVEQPQRHLASAGSLSPSKIELSSPVSKKESPQIVRTAKPVSGLSKDQTSGASTDNLKAKPVVAVKSPELRRVSSNSGTQIDERSATKPDITKKFHIVADTSTANSSAPKNASPTKVSAPGPAAASPLTPNKSRVNTPKLRQTDSAGPTKPTSPKPLLGLGLEPKSSARNGASSVNPSQVESPRKESQVAQKGTPASTPDSAPVSEILDKYFSVMPKGSDKAEFDTHALLVAASDRNPKVKSITSKVWEVTGDGKKTSMPSQQEHILYEDSMYLVVHTYEAPSGNKASEAYLWCGDRTSEAASEDAQLFCKKDAREHGAKLEIVKQGREPAQFFQALGDILITRRSKATALYMLCGRRHMGYMAFDEVDFLAQSLCSGFPYLVSAKFGKLYLWKGRGSAADEIGCARLIGMDMGLTGEIEEIEEGAETDPFWEAFPEPSSKRVWPQEWQLRAEHNSQQPVLYRIEHDRPKSAGGFWGLRAPSPQKSSNKAVVEPIQTLCQRDLDPTHVYILDACRSVYVLLDAQAASKTAEFSTALHLAQEIAMLSPSIQNRSLLPTCFVAFGDPPSDVKAYFRKWQQPTPSVSEKPSACIRLEDIMQALGL